MDIFTAFTEVPLWPARFFRAVVLLVSGKLDPLLAVFLVTTGVGASIQFYHVYEWASGRDSRPSLLNLGGFIIIMSFCLLIVVHNIHEIVTSFQRGYIPIKTVSLDPALAILLAYPATWFWGIVAGAIDRLWSDDVLVDVNESILLNIGAIVFGGVLLATAATKIMSSSWVDIAIGTALAFLGIGAIISGIIELKQVREVLA